MHRHQIWRKSSRSNTNGGACVEVALAGDCSAVRDSKLGQESPVLAFGTGAFDAFLGAVKSGHLDR
ncbi:MULTISPECIES: DUF397 domain-containing protein [unclassified Saccharopolyspora]|uniref:DUF397 domain-containing protein n=1 Tax=unclassified Saccharopolyspora TaxID=2646250 RepID=UPI001CD756B4|nr:MULTISPECIES: DUF397 domain-containing protein [unclassified Saccharopolyspora]MCA1228687.1 DUF397 domain-containing protein [Saccharopolyspora sp. 6M]MCA1282657.1 DUF397 domain-containing protein [Saccharopolyspora sp. 7B]